MQLFPERDSSARRSTRLAVVLSLALHAVLGYLVVAFLLHAPRDTAPEPTAVAETITIQRLATPTPRPTPAPTPVPTPTPPPLRPRVGPSPKPLRAPPRPALAALTRPPRPALAHPMVVPTLAPPAAPRTVRVARVHVPAVKQLAYAPRLPVAPKHPALDARQLAEMEARFRNTIAQAQRNLEATPGPAPVKTYAEKSDQNSYLNVDMNEVLNYDGSCSPAGYDDQFERRGAYSYYFVRCIIHYSDGYTETVAFPWQWKWLDRDNPFLPGGPRRFPGQPPPPGFVLPHPFALSRAVCAFFRAECEAVIQRERAQGLIKG
ncbi:MAG TPA: hypothetical protein VFB22_09810 [Candidatus Baltobacteraceae bacterium]|nr:hypothetical protein [Candidatus Baltobacteraceae bacterium]